MKKEYNSPTVGFYFVEMQDILTVSSLINGGGNGAMSEIDYNDLILR